ncbi:HmuY family protein [Mongoliitalea daihaiensis]|uniref:HmuY family protein n=1 Tax=Mongoliitalea daihaiensis TaxID=2782006 RepID=UPI001F37E83A|nr:HmuY family protein [Mongoliitalea daihaiensis]UJP65646.1 hypothetical protein IPZ59_03180 [Mongoliitalea daihaiensis]
MKLNQLLIGLLVLSMGVFACDSAESPIMEPDPAMEGFIEINGGGASFPNMAFINLRTGEQTIVQRQRWDLAFSTGSDFRVLINGNTGAMAFQTSANDLNQVGDAQAADLRSSGGLDMTFSNMEALLRVDNPSNPLNQPIISPVSTIQADNKVYILNRGSMGAEERPWKKIRILQQNGRYVLQHADVDAATFNTLEIQKNPDFNFVYVSFEQGKVDVEPKKEDWDFVWNAGTATTPFPQAVNGTLAYFFQDLVFHNIYGGVTAVQVLESEIGYDNFNETHLPGLTLNADNRLTIGSNWRGGGGPNMAPTIRNDRFYIVKDTRGNFYKVRFVSLTRDGERGRPSFEYALVKAR